MEIHTSSKPTPNPNLPWAELWQIFSTRSSPDFTFVVGKNSYRLPSYKSFLIARSTELAKLATGTKDDTFFLRDMDPVVFHHFHEFLHTGEFPDNDDFNEEELIKVIRFGAKYCPGREQDVEISQNIFKQRITLKNVFEIHQKSKAWKLSALEDMTWEYIANVNENAEGFFLTQSFLEMDAFSLCEMLKSDELCCDEIKVFEAVLRWGNNKPSPACSTLDLEHVKYHIRFPLMSPSDFAEKVVPTKILSDEDALELFVFFCSSEDKKPKLTKFNSRPRANYTTFGMNTPQEEEYYDDINDEDIIMEVVKEESAPSTPHTSLYPNFIYESEDTRLQPNIVIQYPDPGTPIAETTWSKFIRKMENKRDAQVVEEEVKGCEILQQIGHRVLMPNLKKVTLRLQIRTDRRKTDMTIAKLRENFDLEPYIFFYKDENSSAYPTWKSKIEFELVINGVTFFKMSRAEHELTIGFGEKYTTDLSSRLLSNKLEKYNINKLILVDNELPFHPFPGHTLCEVTLWGVIDPTPQQLGKFLQKLTNLEKLSCRTKRNKWITNKNVRAKSSINLAKDLTSGSNLVKMAVCWTKLILRSDLINELEAAVKENLTELYTDYCHWSPEIFEHFHKIFPNLRRVAFGYCDHECREEDDEDEEHVGHKRKQRFKSEKLVSAVSVRLMTNLRRCSKLEWIRVARLEWVSEPIVQLELDELKLFMQTAGLAFHPTPPSDFILEKVGGGDNARWKGTALKGRNYNEKHAVAQRYWERMDRLEYDHFQLDKVFKDFKTFSAYNVGP